MGLAKDIIVKPISASDANEIVKRLHYSGKRVPNSQLHFGVFIKDRCLGVMQFGPPISKTGLIGLVKDTKWNGFIELNRMAFSDLLPKNSESRAIGYALRTIRKAYPHIEWVVSFADGCQCGDGTIYRASGFVLTAIKRNTSIIKLENGSITTTLSVGKDLKFMSKMGGKSGKPQGATPLEGYQLRYLYFLNPEARKRLTVPILPFSAIKEAGAQMYKGQRALEAEATMRPSSTRK